ncbi:hypothetical protein LCGC14_2962360, partial [marine sediment metagenome]
ATPVFQQAFRNVEARDDTEGVILAAAMLAQGPDGLSVIRDLALELPDSIPRRSEIAQAAWVLAGSAEAPPTGLNDVRSVAKK